MILAGERDPVPATTLIASILGDGVTATIFEADAVDAPSTSAIGFGLAAGDVRGSDVELSSNETRLTAVVGPDRFAVWALVLGETAVYAALAAIAAAVASKHDVQRVVDALQLAVSMGARRMAASRGRNGELVIDDSFGADRAGMASALRSLAQMTQSSGRSVAVLGTFDCASESAVDDHDAIGRLVVRLNVRRLIAVGAEARHLHAAAGLEGSWDGEALIVASPQEAYDLVRDYTRENDVVLVKGSVAEAMHPIADLLSGASQ
jgi:UDP-N-acetylmuramoyl-tripeptide--D-alanyl-D-alanine ligase